MIDKLIGNYRITSELAQGGMGSVYRGRHLNLPREVVVKSILLSSFPPRAQEHLKARFVREAYIQSQLDHPNIVRVYEFFTTEENYYLVMEFIDGMSMRQLIERRGALNPEHALMLFKQALSALAYAHNFSYVDESGRRLSGIIHRDIKPANLLIDGMGRLKITDFGIVKLAGESSMTRTGFNPGTYEYMSPEQIRGQVVDARSDIYSLGVTFYEALSGRLPFPPSDTGSEYEVMKGHTEMPPPPLVEVNPSIPPQLAAIVMRSLEKDPADRFQTAAEWLDALLDYEHNPAAAPQVETEAAIPTQVVDRLTERIENAKPGAVPPTFPATEVMPERNAAGGSATEIYVAGNTVNPAPTRQPAPASSHAPGPSSSPAPALSSVPAYAPAYAAPRSKSGRGAILAAAAIILVLIAAAAAYFIIQQRSATTETAGETEVNAPSSEAPATSASPAAAAATENETLRQAREAEEQERYPDAIRLYEEYLKANPQASDFAALTKHWTELKTFNGHLAIAKFNMDRGDFAEARKDYQNALKMRPSSKLAQTGLAEAEARLNRQ